MPDTLREPLASGVQTRRPAAPAGRICVIFNPHAGGRAGGGALSELGRALDRHPGRFVLRRVARRGNPADAARRALDQGFATVVAAGGDGTCNAVASALAGSGAAMGVIPLGTFNYFARDLGVPQDVGEAVDLIAGSEAVPVTVGDLNGQVFLINASVGIYPAILRQREGMYRRWGRSRLAAYGSVLLAFWRFARSHPMRVTVDGRSLDLRTPLAFVARSAVQLDQFGLDGADCVRDGKLALLAVRDIGRWGLMLLALRLAGGGARRGEDFDFRCGTEIVIETDRPTRLVALDGERGRMRQPFRFRATGDALRVIVPPAPG